MITPAQVEGAIQQPAERFKWPLPSLPEALASLLRTVTVALFLLTFVLQPFLIPSESMEHTLLVGDFLLVNKQVYAPADGLWKHLLPYRNVARGDVVVFHFPQDPKRYLVKRVVGVPGDRIRIENGRVLINGMAQAEPYAAFEPAAANLLGRDFPTRVYTDPAVDPAWWRQEQSLTRDGELVIPPDKYFVLGDNRNHSYDSRSWGFVSRQAIIARPLVIYFSVRRPSTTDVQQAADDRLGHDREFPARLVGFARWKRIFRVVR
ncbi:MAG: signal peptidase I [Acidobacteriota bacterium]